MLELARARLGPGVGREELVMKIRKLGKEMTMSAFLVLLLAAACFAGAPKKHVSIAVFPCTDAVMSFKKFHLLISYLQKETGLDVSLSVPGNYAEFERAVRNGDIDFALQDPHIYVRLAGLYDKGALVRALTREGAATQSGVVIARKDSGIGKLADLKGKTVMFGPRLSAARWLAAKSLFEENGLDIDRDFKAYTNGRCCEDIAFSVYLGAVDAGVVCDHFLGEHSKKQKALGLEAKQIAVVCKTRPVPTRIFAARQKLGDDIVARVNRALLGLDKNRPAHAEILFRAELGGFKKSKDDDYESMRRLLGQKMSE